jgi:hypothetical protein
MSQFGLIGALVSIAIYNPAVESFNLIPIESG